MKPLRLIIFALILASIPIGYLYGRALWVPVYQQLVGKRSVDDVINTYASAAEARLAPYFAKAGATYPPKKMVLLAIKQEQRLELWTDENTTPTFIRSYDIKAASGILGPKLREGDRQVPEGVYHLEYLNPNSSYHLSMKLNYPNAFDRKYAAIEGRDQPGTNIFIHGKAVSIGCLAMGDSAIEELFILVTKTGRANVTVAIAPTDPRKNKLVNTTNKDWVDTLYNELTQFFARYKSSPNNVIGHLQTPQRRTQ